MILNDIADCGAVLHFIFVNIAWRSGATQSSRGKNQIFVEIKRISVIEYSCKRCWRNWRLLFSLLNSSFLWLFLVLLWKLAWGFIFTEIKLLVTIHILTLYTLTSVCIFSILFSIHFLRCWQGEFVEQSWALLLDDHFLYSCDLNMWIRGDLVRRN